MIITRPFLLSLRPLWTIWTYYELLGFFPMKCHLSVPAYACCFPQWKGYCGLPRRLYLLYICPLRSWREHLNLHQPSLLQTDSLTFSVSFCALLLQHPHHRGGPPLDFLFYASFTHLGTWKLFSRCGLTPWMGITTFLSLLAILLLLQPRVLLTFFVARSTADLLFPRTPKFLSENPFLLL